MSRFVIKIDEVLAGTSIEEAIKEAKEKAIQWDVAYVMFNFNGVTVLVGPDTDIQKAIEEFNYESRYHVFN